MSKQVREALAELHERGELATLLGQAHATCSEASFGGADAEMQAAAAAAVARRAEAGRKAKAIPGRVATQEDKAVEKVNSEVRQAADAEAAATEEAERIAQEVASRLAAACGAAGEEAKEPSAATPRAAETENKVHTPTLARGPPHAEAQGKAEDAEAATEAAEPTLAERESPKSERGAGEVDRLLATLRTRLRPAIAAPRAASQVGRRELLARGRPLPGRPAEMRQLGALLSRDGTEEDAEEIGILPAGEVVQVLQLGKQGLVRVTASLTGWISHATFGGEALIRKRGLAVGARVKHPCVGDECEVVSLVTIRQEEFLESDVAGALYIGTIVKVVEASPNVEIGRRVKVTAALKGWVAAKALRRLPEPKASRRRLGRA